MPTRSVTSPDNPLIRLIRRLASAPTSYRELGKVWIEGEHLCRACLERPANVEVAVVSQSAWDDPTIHSWLLGLDDVVIIPDLLFARLSALPSPAGVGMVLNGSGNPEPDWAQPSVVLDGVQDAGNVGSILRSAAALGVQQVLALPGTAGLWSPKVVRAGMGAHFGLRLIECADLPSITPLQLPLVATSSHADLEVWDPAVPHPCHWAFGHEGRGLSQACQALCHTTVRIPQPGGQESLNVAAAAAICLYESLRRGRGGRSQ